MEFDAAQARRNITIRFVEKDFSRFSVYPVVVNYILDVLHLDRVFKDVLKPKSVNHTFSGTEYLLFLFTVMFLGITHLYKADDLLSSETQLARILGFCHGRFPLSKSVYLLLSRMDYWSVKRLEEANLSLIKREKQLLERKRWLVADIDQIKKLTEGKTIERAKPCFSHEKKGKLGLRISASTVEGLVFSQKLEPGNVGNSDAFPGLLMETLKRLDEMSSLIRSRRVRLKKVILRIDGGYFSGKTLTFLEGIRRRRRLDFVVRAKSGLVLIEQARGGKRWQRIDDRTDVIRLSKQQILPDVDTPYTVLIVREKQQRIVSRKKRVREKTVLVEYPLVTTLSHWQTKRIILFYKKRQTIENIFKEFNQSFHAEKLPSHSFWGNALYFQMVSLVSNVAVFFKGRPFTRYVSNRNTGNLTRQIAFARGRNYDTTTGYRN